MKNFKIYISAVIAVLFFNACGLSDIDNYDAPNASVYGGIYDVETGELVEQDLIQGVNIEYIEDGFENPEIQSMVVQNDGTYRNKLMFASTYTIYPVRGNFVSIPKKGVEVKGDTQIDFKVQPYIRIKNAKIEKQGNKIVATFNIQQTVTNTVNRLSLFAHQEPNVGNPLNSVKAELSVDGITYENTDYRLEIDFGENASKLKPGSQYFFRIGALINAPEAKFNYAPAVRLTI